MKSRSVRGKKLRVVMKKLKNSKVDVIITGHVIKRGREIDVRRKD